MKTRFKSLWLVIALATAAPAFAATPTENLALGIKQVEEGDFQAAIATLDGVARALSTDKTRSKELARAYVYTAIAYVGLSEEASAKAKFLAALKNDTALKLSPKEFPPRVIQAFEQATREARILQPDSASVTLFMDAAKREDVPALRRLLQRTPALLSSADPESGATALHWSVLRGHLMAVAFLVGAGTELAAKNNAGETPYDVAVRSNKSILFPWLQPPVAGPRAAPDEVFDAAKRGDVGRLRQILGKDPGALARRDAEFGATALHWASLRGNAATVAFLLGAGADPSVTNQSGEISLTVAQRAGRAAVAELLAP